MASNEMFKRIISTGEEQVSRLASQLIGNEKFVSSLQKMVTSTLSAKGVLDKQVAAAMTAMHVPTTPDVQKLNDRLDQLERIFEGLNSKVDAIAAKFDVKQRAEHARPFVKWVGGKRQLIPELRKHVPQKYGRYHEPFVGGGALFFDLRPKRAVLSDMNERLVRTYRGIQKNVDDVISLLKTYRYDRKFFEDVRKWPIDERSDAEVAAWFVYLNKTGFNGLYRVNSRNIYNVPFGRHTNPAICDEKNLRACAAALAPIEILHASFASATKQARRGDFVYFDPPYVPLTATSFFTSYTANGFGMQEQVELRDVALALKKRGVHVLLSNSGAPDVRKLYRDGFDMVEVQAARYVNSKTSARGPIAELVIF